MQNPDNQLREICTKRMQEVESAMHRGRCIAIGVFCFLFALNLGLWARKNMKTFRHISRCRRIMHIPRPRTIEQEVRSAVFLLLGVLLQDLNSVYNDYFNDINVKYIFFTTENVHSLPSVVYLEKGKPELLYLHVLRHMSRYEAKWFLLTDSNFFVNVEHLNFLESLHYVNDYLLVPETTRENHYVLSDVTTSEGSGVERFSMAQLETKKRHRISKAKSEKGDVMEKLLQPGIIMSKSLLHKFSMLAEHCSKEENDFKTCFEKTTTMSWLNSFVQNSTVDMYSTCKKKDLTKIIVADLSQNLKCLVRLRVQLLSKELLVLSTKRKELERRLSSLQNTAHEKKDMPRQFHQPRIFFNLARKYLINSKVSWSLRFEEREGVARTIGAVMDTISNAHQEPMQFNALYYGYMLNRPISGLEYVFNIFSDKERHIARSRQHFGAIESRVIKVNQQKTVNVVVPLAGRLENFRQFMLSMEHNVLKKREPVNILVVYFPETSPSAEHKNIFHKYNTTYSILTWLDLPGMFARARALQAAVEYFKDNKLLFFADVDLTFNADFLQRCRDNTVARQLIYFPVMFKLFNPNILGFLPNTTNYFRVFDKRTGDWARHSFGPVCAYRDDVIAVGGFNVKIKEWGYEDIQLFESFISKKYDVIRAADPGLLHIYHPHTKCEGIKNNIQRLMCTGAVLDGLASEDSIAQYLQERNYTNNF